MEANSKTAKAQPGSLHPVVSWRRGMDSTAHAILDCDPMASAWVAVCGVLITGKQSSPNDFKCPVCVRDTKPANKDSATSSP